MSYHYSKYNIEIEYNDDYLVLNSLSSSLIKLNSNKFNALKKMDLSLFSKEEIKALDKMGFISCIDEYEYILKKRKQAFANQKNDIINLTILTTTDCNARCYYCYEKGINKNSMSYETADKIIGYILEKGYKYVRFNWFGGEPLYNSGIITYLCKKLQDLNIEYYSSMVSNSYLINENADNIKGLWNLKTIQVTVDALSEEYNKIKNFIYKNDNAFERVMNNIQLLLELNVNVNVRINFNPSYIDDTLETIDYIYNKFGNNDYLYVYCAWLSGANIKKPDDFDNEKNPYLIVYDRLIKCGYIKSISEIGIYNKLLNCNIYRDNSLVIDANGDLHKCQHSVIDSVKAIGNVYKYNEIDDDKVNFWQDLSYPYDECKNCKALPICQGGCKHRAYFSGDNSCLEIKNCLGEIAKLFYENMYRKE